MLLEELRGELLEKAKDLEEMKLQVSKYISFNTLGGKSFPLLFKVLLNQTKNQIVMR